jgi:hypothetical protein
MIMETKNVILSRNMQVRPGRDVLVSQVGDELVFLDLASERYFGLDAVGRALWERLTTAATAGDALDALITEFEVERDTLERDLTDLVSQLAARQLIELSDGPTR